MATPQRPIAASPFRASFGNSFSLSQRAAFGASCSRAKRRTASRISACCSESAIASDRHVGDGVVAVDLPALRVALGGAVDAAPAELQYPCRAIHVPAFRRAQERGIELGGQRVLVDAHPRLDREPHGAIGCPHPRRAVEGPPRALAPR